MRKKIILIAIVGVLFTGCGQKSKANETQIDFNNIPSDKQIYCEQYIHKSENLKFRINTKNWDLYTNNTIVNKYSDISIKLSQCWLKGK